jgi:hypothetical protein
LTVWLYPFLTLQIPDSVNIPTFSKANGHIKEERINSRIYLQHGNLLNDKDFPNNITIEAVTSNTLYNAK